MGRSHGPAKPVPAPESAATDSSAATSGRAFRQILQNASYLTLAQVATRIAGFAYVLVLARLLPEAPFGVLNLTLSVLLIADMIADVGVSRLALRDLARDPGLTEAVLSRLIPLKAALSGATYLGLVACALVLDATPLFLGILAVAGLSLLPSGLSMLLESVLHAQQRFAVVSVAHVCLSVGQAGLGIAVLLAGGGALAVAATYAATYAGFLAALAVALFRTGLRPTFRLDPTFCRTWLMAALPFSIVGVVFALTLRIDLLVLGWFAAPGAVAIYAMTNKVLEAALLATIALGTALAPSFAQYHSESPDKLAALYLRSLRFALLLTIPAALGAMALGPPILRLLLPPAFDGVGEPLRIVLAGFPFWVIYYLNASLLLGTDRQYRATAVLLVLVLGQFAISLVLVPGFGAAGAATAFAASGVVSSFGTTLEARTRIGCNAPLAATLAWPLAGGSASMALLLAGGDWWLPGALAIFAGTLAAERQLRPALLARPESRCEAAAGPET